MQQLHATFDNICYVFLRFTKTRDLLCFACTPTASTVGFSVPRPRTQLQAAEEDIGHHLNERTYSTVATAVTPLPCIDRLLLLLSCIETATFGRGNRQNLWIPT